MPLKLAMTEIQRWADVYCDNAIFHESNGDHAQSALCLRMSCELDNTLQLLNAVNALQEDTPETMQFLSEAMKVEAAERLKLLDWPVTNMIVDALETT